jgi:hypothetical protein
VRVLLLLVLILDGVALAEDCPDAATVCGATQTQCGICHCTDPGQVCCASAGHPELHCAAGEACTMAGTCIPAASDMGTAGDGGAAACTGGGALTLANCGGDSCGCSAPCSKPNDCESGCCTSGGYCAPACVCNQNGRLFLNCDTSGAGFGPVPSSKSCAGVPGAPGGRDAWILALLLAPLLARRRRRAC